MITDAAKDHNIAAVYGLFSGGHDSLVATYEASQHSLFRGVIHIDTGTGLPETRQFVEETCMAHGWPLHIIKPVTTYEALIVQHGFPGPAAHSFMYRYLKERPLRAIVKQLRADLGSRRIGLASGVRKQESEQRMIGASADASREGSKVWLPVISEMSALDVGGYIKSRGLKRSPVRDALHLSGECFCGSFARPSERNDLSMWYRHQAQRIERWESLVKWAYDNQQQDTQAGFSCPNKIKPQNMRWGHGRGQPVEQQHFLHMCATCEATRKTTREIGE